MEKLVYCYIRFVLTLPVIVVYVCRFVTLANIHFLRKGISINIYIHLQYFVSFVVCLISKIFDFFSYIFYGIFYYFRFFYCSLVFFLLLFSGFLLDFDFFLNLLQNGLQSFELLEYNYLFDSFENQILPKDLTVNVDKIKIFFSSNSWLTSLNDIIVMVGGGEPTDWQQRPQIQAVNHKYYELDRSLSFGNWLLMCGMGAPEQLLVDSDLLQKSFVIIEQKVDLDADLAYMLSSNMNLIESIAEVSHSVESTIGSTSAVPLNNSIGLVSIDAETIDLLHKLGSNNNVGKIVSLDNVVPTIDLALHNLDTGDFNVTEVLKVILQSIVDNVENVSTLDDIDVLDTSSTFPSNAGSSSALPLDHLESDEGISNSGCNNNRVIEELDFGALCKVSSIFINSNFSFIWKLISFIDQYLFKFEFVYSRSNVLRQYMDLYRHTMIELFFFDFVIDLGKSIDNAMLNVMHIIKTMSYVSKLFDKFHSHLESFLGINIIDSRLVLIEGGRLYELLIGRHLIGTWAKFMSNYNKFLSWFYKEFSLLISNATDMMRVHVDALRKARKKSKKK